METLIDIFNISSRTHTWNKFDYLINVIFKHCSI